ncbi:MAG: prolyl oligopeptidase family serine peptidase [Acidobacteria bacterium]|nr:prolyl oligopeptidase family serine peptidase [Acidobacteriota bacterium]
MFKRILIFTVLVVSVLTFNMKTAAQMPPLIDRELLFGNPEIAGAQISPDGKYIAFMKPYKDTRNIWVKRTDEPFDKAKLITNRTDRPIPGFFWSRDGKFILFTQDKGGDENYNVYAVNPNDAPASGADVPAARNLTDAQKVRAQIFAVPKSEPDAIYVGLNDRDPAWHDLYKVKISTGERTLLQKNTDRFGGWVFDNNDKLRLAVRTSESGDTEIMRVDAGNKFTKIYTCNIFESCGPVRFNKDNTRVYMQTNKGNPDLMQLTLFNPETLKEELVESDPKNRVDFGDAIFSDLTDELIATAYEDERTRIYWKDKNYEADYKFLQGKYPNKEINFGSSTADEQLWLVSMNSDTEPGETFLFNRKTRQITPQYKIREKINRTALAPMKSVTYKSSDGLEIPAFLTLPKGVEAKNLPVIIFPHGGPWARDGWGYNSFAQFWANRGYAVLEPNFRSSTGYGKKFLNAGNNQWGDKMQDDLTWGVKYLIAEGIGDPKRIGIMGGSYGGYATLAGVTFTPDLYAAAVAYVAPSNLMTLLETIPPYWEAGRIVFYKRMGDPNTPEGKAQLLRQSPLNSADKIKTPLMVVQGANDPRVNIREANQIVVALRDRNYPVEYIVAPDEGHGFARPVNNMAMLAAAEKFFAKHLGGRYQESMTPEVTTRLKEITVDPKDVKLAQKMDASKFPAPKPTMDLKAEKSEYKSSINLGGQNVPLSSVYEIKDEGGAWMITEDVTTPQGVIKEMTVVEKGTLMTKKRSFDQMGQMKAEMEYKDGKATGTMTMGGQSKPISADLGGAMFADGTGAFSVIATLPLADAYATTFRNYDVEKNKVKTMMLKVVGMEKVIVPAGSFDAYKITLTSEDGSDNQTVWIDKTSRKVVKVTAVLAQLGGAVLTSELAK